MQTSEPCRVMGCLGLGRARAAPASSGAARPCPSCAGPGGVFLGGGAERAGDPDAAARRAAMRSVGTSLHAVVMRGVWASVPSWVTPGRSAPPPAAQVRLHPSARRPHGAVFFRRECPSRCQDPQGPFFDPFPNLFFFLNRSHAPLARGLSRPRWASGVFYFQITSACLPCRSCVRGGKSPLGW